MNRFRALLLPLFAVVAGCGDGSGPGQVNLDCEDAAPVVLAPGQVAIQDASETACLRLSGDGIGAGGAQYLYLAYSSAGGESRTGTSADYRLAGSAPAPPPAAAAATRADSPGPAADVARALHERLRAIGQDLARGRRGRAGSRTLPAARAMAPDLGEQRTFNVLRSASVPGTSADDYVQVDATARYVGPEVAIFLDDAAPVEGGYTQDDLDDIGGLFDDYLHPINVHAFGSETDVNGDGIVLVLLTDRVTRLADCDAGQIVVGLFFAVDLFEDLVGSNNAEIFYGLTPDAECDTSREEAIQALPSVFIHEFQHMINYGQHVIQRDGDAEDTWLDEGLAGFAEELGGRLVPNDRCLDNDCLTQFHLGNLGNSYRYLSELPDAYLIGPRQPPLPLSQYGASWLFVRWLADHFADDATLGTDLTRALVQTTATGTDNVLAATEAPFNELVADWQLANYLDDHPDYAELTAGTRFTYTSWNLRQVYADFNAQDPTKFPDPYPLTPDVFTGADYSRTGALRAGSGQHLLVEQPAGTTLDLLLTAPGGGGLTPDVFPHAAILRLR